MLHVLLTCSLFGPSATRSLSSVIPRGGRSVRYCFVFLVSIEKVCVPFSHSTFCNDHAICNTMGAPSLQPMVFPLGFHRLATTALVVSILKQLMTFLRTCCFTSSLAPGSIKFTFAIFYVPWSCVIVTRLALYCICDHENFMSFEIALSFFDNVLRILRNLCVFIPCRRSLKIILPSIFPCLGTEELPGSATEINGRVFCASASVN